MKSRIIALFVSLLLCLATIIPVKAQDQNQYPVYVIQTGDTLTSVAGLFGVSVDDLISFNNLTNPNFVSVGTHLSIPNLPGITGTFTSIVVQLGDTYGAIIDKYQMDASLFKRLNHITSPGEIFAGRTVLVLYTEKSNNRIPISSLDTDQTFLEIAAAANLSPWSLLEQNGASNEYSTVSSAVLFGAKSDFAKQASPFGFRLTNVSISPLPLVQGKTFVISVDSPQTITLSGSLNGVPLHFFANSTSQQVALQGISAIADPGLAPFKLSVSFSDGSTYSIDSPVLLLDGGYPTAEPLTVDPATIDPNVVGPEEKLIESYTSVITPEKYWSGVFTRPGFYPDITASFGERRSYNNGAYTNFHAGVDFGGGEGLPIVAAADGVVVYTGSLEIRGNATIIDHGWGVFTAYFHQSKIDVKVGEKVTMGQKIGEVGHTGRVDNSAGFQNAGAHLHWEVWVNGVQVDPLQWLDKEYP